MGFRPPDAIAPPIAPSCPIVGAKFLIASAGWLIAFEIFPTGSDQKLILNSYYAIYINAENIDLMPRDYRVLPLTSVENS